MAMSILFAGQIVGTKGTAARFYNGHMDSIYWTRSVHSIYCANWKLTSCKMNELDKENEKGVGT